VLENGDTDNYHYAYILSRVDLTPDTRRYWDEIVARMTGTTITTNDATVILIAQRMAWRQWYGWNKEPTETPDALWGQFVCRTQDRWLDDALALIAALTGVPHD
jgi:hypothetical protein